MSSNYDSIVGSYRIEWSGMINLLWNSSGVTMIDWCCGFVDADGVGWEWAAASVISGE
jgi:hypothetical protein